MRVENIVIPIIDDDTNVIYEIKKELKNPKIETLFLSQDTLDIIHSTYEFQSSGYADYSDEAQIELIKAFFGVKEIIRI